MKLKMHKLIPQLIAIFFMSGCATINNYNTQQRIAGLCGATNLLREPNLNQLKCMEEKGKSEPNYTSVQNKIEALEERAKYEFEAEVARCTFSKLKFKAPIGGILRFPAATNSTAVREKINRFCKERGFRDHDINELSNQKEYVGTVGSSSAACTGYGCFGGSSSEAQYDEYSELSFSCT